MIFVGYQPGTKGYRAYDPVTNRVTITRDAVFDENASWDWSSPDTPVNTFGDDSFAVEHMVFEPQPTPGDGSAGPAPDSPTPGVGSTSSAGSPTTPEHPTAEILDSGCLRRRVRHATLEVLRYARWRR